MRLTIGFSGPDPAFEATPVVSMWPTIGPEPNGRINNSRRIGKCWPRLPPQLGHALKDNRAVAIHALRSSLQGSRQDCGEPRRLFPADIPGRDSAVVATRRLCTINTGAPFNHVEVYLQNALFAEDKFGHRYQGELCALTEDRAARSEE